MHHVAFEIAPEDVEALARHLESHGVDDTFVPHVLPEAMAHLTPEQIERRIADVGRDRRAGARRRRRVRRFVLLQGSRRHPARVLRVAPGVGQGRT
jgi:hypothetical protein